MADARSAYLAKKNTPAVGSYGGGEDFGSPFTGGQHQPPGTTNEAAVPYGGGTPTVTVPPSDGGGGGDDPLNVTGSGATGGDDITRSSFFTPSLDLIDGGPKFGFDNYANWLMLQNEATADQFTPQYTQNLIANEPAEVNLMPSTPTGWDLNPLPENLGGGSPGIGYYGNDFSAVISKPNQFQFEKNVGPGTLTGTYDDGTYGFGYEIPFGNAQGGPISKYDEGGPVGESEIDQSGIASLYPEMAESPREPFGATRENVGEQLEAWRNAPHHVDPPNIGFMGEQVPAPLFDKAMKYLDSLPPSERAVIEEMFRRNIMRKRMEEAQQMQETQPVPTLDA
jgi:hypothetical protein